MLEKDLEGQGCGWQPKSFIHTPKPQIPSVESRKRRLGKNNTLGFLVKREESTSFDVFFGCFLCGVWKREKHVEKHVEKPGKE